VEQICGGMSVFPTAEKTLSVLVNLILPLCMRMGGGGGNRTGQHSLSLSLAAIISVLLFAISLFARYSAQSYINTERLCSTVVVSSVRQIKLTHVGGSVAEWLACWTQAQKGLGSYRSRVTVLGKLFTPIVPLFTKQQNW